MTHTTHFDDCGCRSEGYEREITELKAENKRLGKALMACSPSGEIATMLTLVKTVDKQRDEIADLRERLREIANKPTEVIEMFRKNDIVFTADLQTIKDKTHPDFWEKVAFTLYTDIVECASIAESALTEKEDT